MPDAKERGVQLPPLDITQEQRMAAVEEIYWSGAQGSEWRPTRESLLAELRCRERQLAATTAWHLVGETADLPMVGRVIVMLNPSLATGVVMERQQFAHAADVRRYPQHYTHWRLPMEEPK